MRFHFKNQNSFPRLDKNWQEKEPSLDLSVNQLLPYEPNIHIKSSPYVYHHHNNWQNHLKKEEYYLSIDRVLDSNSN